MFKWVYDRMVSEYQKETKEELIMQLMSLSELECKDRAFANHCKASSITASINTLFSDIQLLKDALENPNHSEYDIQVKLDAIFRTAVSAEKGWDYIKHGITEINDDCRCSANLESFKQRVNNATKADDTI